MTMNMQPAIEVAHPPVPFNYSELPAEHAKLATDAAAAIKTSGKRMADYALTIGQKLTAVKAVLDHGQFGAWLVAEFAWTDRTARNYMTAWAAFGDKSETISNLTPTTLYTLAAPSTPMTVREQVVERLEAGERVGSATVKDMIAEAKSRAAMAAQEARIDPKERERQARNSERRRQRQQRDLQREMREQQERESREKANAETVANLIVEALGARVIEVADALSVDPYSLYDFWSHIQARIRQAADEAGKASEPHRSPTSGPKPR